MNFDIFLQSEITVISNLKKKREKRRGQIALLEQVQMITWCGTRKLRTPRPRASYLLTTSRQNQGVNYTPFNASTTANLFSSASLLDASTA
jgi:hypothetical protein